MKLLKQILKFIGASGIGWIIDFIIYNILLTFLKVNIANMISSLCGVTFVFIMSTRKIFTNNNNIKIKYLIYITYQIVLILTASYIMLLIKEYLLNYNINLIKNYINIIVKLIITPFTMTINFVVTKYLIEKI